MPAIHLEKYGVDPVRLAEELLMREGWTTFEDFVADIERRYGPNEAQRVRDTMSGLMKRDIKTQGLAGKTGFEEYARANWLTQNMGRYALIAAPDAGFLNGVEIGMDLVAEIYAEPGTARGSEVQSELGSRIDAVFAKRGVPYRFEADKFVWNGDAGAHALVVQPALHAMADARLAGARGEFDAALSHLRVGTLKDREDAIEEAAKAVESAMTVLITETNTPLTATATANNMLKALKDANVVPAYTEAALLGAARIRNKLGAHGAGAAPRQINLDEATIAVSSAAAALVFLASRLP
jgi:hypothetical protein